MHTRRCLIPLTLLVLLTGGCADRQVEAGRANPATTSTSVPSTTAPAPDGLGLIELTSTAEPTDAAMDTAMDLRQQVIDHMQSSGWTDAAGATAAGFAPMAGDESHWVNPAFETDGRTFDPSAPEFLVLDGDSVVAAMFLAAAPGIEAPDPPGAPFVRWHYHRFGRTECLENGLVVVSPPVDGQCAEGATPSDISPLMAHVWITDMEDPFTPDMAAHHH